MRIIYNALFLIFFALSSPYYFLRMWRRGNWLDGFRQRFGHYDGKLKQAITNRQVIWLHAVSVGEVNICTQLIRALEPRAPNLKIIVSTTTTTGMGELKRKLPSHIAKIYYPVDRKKCVQRALSTLRPEAIVLVEAEIWPNFLWQAADRNIPVFLVNARLSDRSYRGYKRFGVLFRGLFASFAGVGVQSAEDAVRLRDLGCGPDTVHIMGNMKFDSAKLNERRLLDVPAMLRQLGVSESARLLVCGSTHSGEEEILAQCFKRLKQNFPDLFLVLVPRHFERGREVGRVLEKCGISFAYRSEVAPSYKPASESIDCLLVNSTGELKYFYERASVIFVGKSLTAQGGQNPIEPGALGKAMVFGPNMQNFAAIARAFVKNNAAVQVQKPGELEQALSTLLANEKRCQELGQNALKVVTENQGAVERTVEMIIGNLPNEEVYVAKARKK